jgi:G3E family GTPase
MTDKIPVTLLTGFLGSGKSTLLSEILTDPAFANSAVIVNEFGEVGLDDFLVTHREEQVVEMTTGCLCCTVRGDISSTLTDLFDQREKGELNAFDRVIIETTGLADPAPVIHTIASDQAIYRKFNLSGVITTVDALNGMNTLDSQKECVKQAAVADRLVITKTDMDIDEAAIHDLKHHLKKLNPSAVMFDKQAQEFSLKGLFDTQTYNPQTKSMDVQGWLGLDGFKKDHHHAHEGHSHEHHDHDHHHHHHDVNKHGDHIETFALFFDEPIIPSSFTLAMQLLIMNFGENLLRIKGVVCLENNQDHPVVIHGVQHVFHEPIELEKWPSDDRRSKLVFITRNISKDSLIEHFSAWNKVDAAQDLAVS